MLAIGNFACQGQRQVASAAVGLASLSALMLVALPAQASVPLTRADVEALRNRVEFIPRGRSARVANMSDILSVGDALRTAVSAQADLRFNDGSLARVGERATFRFVPNTRNFRLTNGTVLLLIPSGQGRTNIQTPSAVTGIQGSAVVVRYLPDRDLTVVMALTNNPAGPMTITAGGCAGGNPDACVASEYSLYGGQMALIQNNQVQVVEFDLPLFYQTSSLVEGLELDNPNAESPLGPALESVREETLEALEGQTAFEGGVQLPPELISLDGNQFNSQDWNLSPSTAGVSPLTTLRGLLSPESTVLNLPDVSAQQPSSASAPPSGGQRPAANSSAGGNTGATPPTASTPGGTAGQTPASGNNTGATPPSPSSPGNNAGATPPTTSTPGGNVGQPPATGGGTTGVTPTPPAVVTPTPPTVVTPTPPAVITPAPPAVVTPTPPTVVTPAPVVNPAPPTVVTPTPPAVVTPTPPTVVTPAPPTVIIPTPVITPTPPTVVIPTPVVTPPTVVIPTLPQDPTGGSGLVPGVGPGNSGGPGNAQPPPFTNPDFPGNAQPPPFTNLDFPANPPAEPGPFSL